MHSKLSLDCYLASTTVRSFASVEPAAYFHGGTGCSLSPIDEFPATGPPVDGYKSGMTKVNSSGVFTTFPPTGFPSGN